MVEPPLVPVTVIGGYLGAGKTTVVNQLLTEPHGRRLAVLVNDFGALDIDARLIAATGAKTVSLANGCVCCSIADALGDGLDEVLALDPQPEQIVIEASGAADPAKIAVYGQGWPGVRLDAVLTVVDGTTMEENAADRFVGSLIGRQLRAADVVLLSKTDLMDDASLAAARSWLADRLGATPVVVLDYGRVPPSLILERVGQGDRRPGPSPVPEAGEANQAAAGLFDSLVLPVDDPIERLVLEAALNDWPDAVVRVKGFVRTTEPGEPTYEVHRVGRRWTIRPSARSDGNEGLVLVVLRGSVDGEIGLGQPIE